jgi:hypothetical protein
MLGFAQLGNEHGRGKVQDKTGILRDQCSVKKTPKVSGV